MPAAAHTCGQCLSGEVMFGSSARHGALSCLVPRLHPNTARLLRRLALQIGDSHVAVRLLLTSSQQDELHLSEVLVLKTAEDEASTEAKGVAACPAAELPRAVT